MYLHTDTIFQSILYLYLDTFKKYLAQHCRTKAEGRIYIAK
jgi:hypothetical protein